jgi:hypothetical protein
VDRDGEPMKKFPDSASGWVRYAIVILFTISVGLLIYGHWVSGMRGAGYFHFYSRMALRWAIASLFVASILGARWNQTAGIFGFVSTLLLWFLYLLTDGVRET